MFGSLHPIAPTCSMERCHRGCLCADVKERLLANQARFRSQLKGGRTKHIEHYFDREGIGQPLHSWR